MPDGRKFFGSPTKLFEYMSMGRPIVASRLDQLADVLENDRTALLVTPGSAIELSSAILSIAEDRARHCDMGAKARETAKTSHTWKAITEQWLRVLLEPHN